MMLETLGEQEAAFSVEQSVKNVVKEKLETLAAGRMGYSTTEVGDFVAKGL